MARKTKYSTKQMEELIKYLETTNGEHFNVKDICDYFSKLEINVGTTTVYRNLEKLIDDGSVLKYNSIGANGACYEYIGDVEKPSKTSCFHLICETCGDVEHLKSDVLLNIDENICKDFGFTMKSLSTVLYGNCKDCSNE